MCDHGGVAAASYSLNLATSSPTRPAAGAGAHTIFWIFIQEVAVEYGDPTQACGSNIPLQGTPSILAHRNRNCSAMGDAGGSAGYGNGAGFRRRGWRPTTTVSTAATKAGDQEDRKNHGKGHMKGCAPRAPLRRPVGIGAKLLKREQKTQHGGDGNPPISEVWAEREHRMSSGRGRSRYRNRCRVVG